MSLRQKLVLKKVDLTIFSLFIVCGVEKEPLLNNSYTAAKCNGGNINAAATWARRQREPGGKV